MTARTYVCPVCRTMWSPPLRIRAGEQCGDLSQGQTRRCVGRLIRAEEFERAEWRRPRYAAAAGKGEP